MSQFLWVEDFENNPQATTESVFGSILPDAKIPDTKEEIKKFLKKDSKYRVLVELTFWDAWQFIHNSQQLSQVDYILLDIDLNVRDNDDDDKEEGLLEILNKYYNYHPCENGEQDTKNYDQATKELKKIAGYQLYVALVTDLGFPKEHILFCSNHGEEMKTIRKAFDTAKMELPKIFSKKDKAELSDWIIQKRENEYMVLRRGIIEGCQRISLQIAKHPEFIQFYEFIKPGTAVREITPKDMQEYLATLQKLLPLREPQDKQQFYKLFLRTLTHEWDSADPKLQQDDKVKLTFGWILKNARNWSTHTTVLDNLQPAEVAFLFMVAMRAMFKLEPISQPYEDYLLTLFGGKEVPELDTRKIPLAKTYSEIKQIVIKEKLVDDTTDFHTMLNGMVNKNVAYNHYVTGLFQMFWHGIFPTSHERLKSNIYPMGNKAHLETKSVYTFDGSYNFGDKKDFLYKFARCIYKKSFPSV